MGSLSPKNNIITYWYYDKNDLNNKGKPKRKAESLRHPVTGSPLRPKIREDQKLAKEIKRELDYRYKQRRAIVLKGRYTVKQATEDFFSEKRLDMSVSYRVVFDAAFVWLFKAVGIDKQVTEFTKEDINRFREVMGEGQDSPAVKHNTRVTYLNHVKVLFKWLIEEKDCPLSLKIFPKKVNYLETEIPYIEPFVMKSILEFLKNRNKNQYRLIFFLNDNGFRPGEALALTKSQVKFDQKYIMFHNIKGKRIAPFPLSEDSEKLLKEIIRDHKKEGIVTDRFFLYSENGLDFFPRLVRSALKEARKELHPLHGIIKERFVLYDIRRTFATDLAASTDNIMYVMTLMRHRDIRTTQKYYAIPRVQKMRTEMARLKENRLNEYETVKEFRKMKGNK